MKIKELILFTGNFDAQKYFYSNLLELELAAPISENEMSFKIGDTVLSLINKKDSTPYHFAFNIYSDKENEALLWLKDRLNILKDGEFEIQNFESWNAKAIYFYDENKNIVEFIARKNLDINNGKSFNSKSILGLSEIGLPVENITAVYNKLNDEIRLPIYSGTLDEFCAVGDEHGLIICVDQNKKKWFPVFDKAYPSEFRAVIENDNKSFSIEYLDGEFNISKL